MSGQAVLASWTMLKLPSVSTACSISCLRLDEVTIVGPRLGRVTLMYRVVRLLSRVLASRRAGAVRPGCLEGRNSRACRLGLACGGRVACGEITREQFEQLRDDLK